MDLSTIKERWANPMKDASREGVKAWDSVASDYVYKNSVTFENNSFLQFIQSKVELTPDMSSLDIGCGAGAYSLAMAEKIKRAVGVDFSPKMIELAGKTAGETGINNAEFYECDWYGCDGSKYRGRFDIVFAHTTPAVADYDTFMKMIEASKRYCFICKPARRTDEVFDRLCSMTGRGGHGQDDSVAYMFDVIWSLGYNPEFCYEKAVWKSKKDLGKAKTWYLGRLSSFGALNEEEENRVVRYLSDISVDGQVVETINTTLVNIFWEKV